MNFQFKFHIQSYFIKKRSTFFQTSQETRQSRFNFFILQLLGKIGDSLNFEAYSF